MLQHLDVNVAVNNLLSRDDDDDGGEPEDSAEYALAGISYLHIQ